MKAGQGLLERKQSVLEEVKNIQSIVCRHVSFVCVADAKSKPDRTNVESRSKVKPTQSLSRGESKDNLKDRSTEQNVESSHRRAHTDY